MTKIIIISRDKLLEFRSDVGLHYRYTTLRTSSVEVAGDCLAAFSSGEPVTFDFPGLGLGEQVFEAYVMGVRTFKPIESTYYAEIELRPARQPLHRDFAAEAEEAGRAALWHAEQDWYALNGLPNCRCAPLELDDDLFDDEEDDEEDGMKVYEAIVVSLNKDTKLAEEIVQGPTVLLAASAAAARDQVLVEYASQKFITGKDLAGYSVRIREFRIDA